MSAPRRAVLALPMLAAARPAFAAPFPDRAIRLVVPYAAGGNSDAVARIVASPMSEILGQPVVVENRPGAGGGVASVQMARLRPDGYNIMIGSNGPMAVSPSIQPNIGYDPLRDFAPIGMACRTPHVIVVTNNLPVRDLREFVAYAQERQGQMTLASSGVGSSGHLSIATFAALTGTTLQHVPYLSGGQLIPDLMSGTVNASIIEISTVLPLHRSGQVRILAVAAAGRSVLAPEIPTAEEAGVPGFREAAFIGIVMPANPPAEVQERLAAAFAAALARPETSQRLHETGSEESAEADRTPAGFAAFLETELRRTQAAAVRAGLRPA